MKVVVDLFCGVGGLSLGFGWAGWEIACGVDVDPSAVAIYRELVGAPALVADVRDLTGRDLPEADVIIGGPPCQPYSQAGRRLGPADPRDGLGDFARLVEGTRPRAFLMENVPGLPSHSSFREFVARVQGAGYAIAWRVVDAADFGVPQNRQRVFVVGLREKSHALFPWPLPTHTRRPTLFSNPWVGAGEVLVPLLERREPDLEALPRWIASRWKHLPPDRQDEVLVHPQLARWDTTGGVLVVRPLSQPAFTVTASGAGRGFFVVHNGRYYRLTLPETAALQGLPFVEGMTAGHVGNAVPPAMARALAEALAGMLEKKSD